MPVVTVGLDLAKIVFQAHGVEPAKPFLAVALGEASCLPISPSCGLA
ncbi:hypothetical protein [Mesorhizobium sp.]|nr:hypothetical protein [Mesorhizobium sp.]